LKKEGNPIELISHGVHLKIRKKKGSLTGIELTISPIEGDLTNTISQGSQNQAISLKGKVQELKAGVQIIIRQKGKNHLKVTLIIVQGNLLDLRQIINLQAGSHLLSQEVQVREVQNLLLAVSHPAQVHRVQDLQVVEVKKGKHKMIII
jgi:hypothetical protein